MLLLYFWIWTFDRLSIYSFLIKGDSRGDASGFHCFAGWKGVYKGAMSPGELRIGHSLD